MHKKFQISSVLKNKARGKIAIGFLTLAILFLFAALPVLALETGLEYGTATGLGTTDIRVMIMNIVRVVLGLVGIIALVITIYAGYLWMTAAGNEEKISQAKSILRNAVIGLIIIFSAFSIVSFIIGMLTGQFGTGPTPGPVPPVPPCENCGHLGGGIIESVYPAPLAKEVARDTEIIVTFKEVMTPDTIIAGAAAVCTSGDPCSGNLAVAGGKPNVRIYMQTKGEGEALAANAVTASSNDGKTFTFHPLAPLGDSVNKNWYVTKLTNAIKRANGDSAFPSVGDYFSWTYEIGTKLDLLPPQMTSVFPVPDDQNDAYDPANASQSVGQINITKQPNINQAASQALITACTGSTDTRCDGPTDITPTDDPSSSRVTLGGGYNGLYSGTLALQVESDFSAVKVTSWTTPTAAGVTYFNAGETFTINAAQRAELLHGLYLVFQEAGGSNARGKTFSVQVTTETQADTLQIADLTYKFVPASAAAPAANEIKISDTVSKLIDNIVAKIQSDVQKPDVEAWKSGTTIMRLRAKQAGSSGNYIPLNFTGNWGQKTPFAGGSDETVSAVCSGNGVCDQPKNVTIRLDFNEGLSPVESSGRVVTKANNAINTGAGELLTADFDNLLVQADLNGNDKFEADEYVSGTFVQSNQYKTVEFVSLSPCKGTTGEVIKNSCGDTVYCLPVNPNEDFIEYKVTVKAAALELCSANSCAGKGYEDGTLTDQCQPIPNDALAAGAPSPVCGNSGGRYFMKGNAIKNGVVDLSNNSLDGNGDKFAAGPSEQSKVSAFSLNNLLAKVCDFDATNADADCTGGADVCQASAAARPESCRAAGDDLSWTFYIRNKVELSAPVVLNVSPTISGSGQSLISPVNSRFNKLLLSSTVKPGTGYADGKCTCAATAAPYDCPNSDQICVNQQCVNQNQEQILCSRDTECNAGRTCQTKKYVTLYDLSTQPVGWWISNGGEDVKMCLNESRQYADCANNSACGSGGICGIKDGYSDRSLVAINHTAFLESTKYSAELASGVKDIYQNCLVPAKGPNAAGTVKRCSVSAAVSCTADTDCPASERCIGFCDFAATGANGCCEVDDDNPYCCNGVKSPTACNP